MTTVWRFVKEFFRDWLGPSQTMADATPDYDPDEWRQGAVGNG